LKNIFLILALFLIFAIDGYAKNIPNEYLIKYRSIDLNVIGLKSLGLDSIFVKSFFLGKRDALVLKQFEEIGILHVFLSDSEKKSFLESKKGSIEYIEANREVKALGKVETLPTIPKSQWGLDSMDILEAWETTLGSKEIVVGVIDSGVDYNHFALKANMWTGENGEHGWNFIDDSNDPMDDNSHGTHCAGVIAANSKYFMGVAPNVKIMALKFLSAEGSGATDGAISAIYYGVKHGAKVLSNSWGGGGYQKSLRDAVAYANANSVLFVAAAGNEYNNNDRKASYPASYKVDNVISVGAMDINKKKASFSNYGKKSVHVFAAGVDIYSTVPNGKGQYMSGTSMATPFVAGLAALIYSKEPSLSPIEVKERIIKNVDKEISLSGYCSSGGYIKADKIFNQD
jgi:subtilisin family serine protease